MPITKLNRRRNIVVLLCAIYSVEGNVDDRCIENSHYVGTSSIYGFGLPQY